MKVLLSPTEQDLASELNDEAISSPIPEEKGADVLLYTPNGLFAIQRKKIPTDFLLSVEDGRLTRELALLKQCEFSRLVLEEPFKYWYDGTVDLGYRMVKGKRVHAPSKYTRAHIFGILNEIEMVHGVTVRQTDDIKDTVAYIRSINQFMKSSKHTGLYGRPSAKGRWITPTSHDLHLWILQSWPGIGPALADSIIQHFGKVPLKWTCTEDQLAEISRLPKKKARDMINSLETGISMTSSDHRDFDSHQSEIAIGDKSIDKAFASLRERLASIKHQ